MLQDEDGVWHREGEEGDEDEEEAEEADENDDDDAGAASNSESVEISLYEEQHRRRSAQHLHAHAHAQQLNNQQRPHSSSQVIIVDHQDHYGQASFNNPADYHQQVRQTKSMYT